MKKNPLIYFLFLAQKINLSDKEELYQEEKTLRLPTEFISEKRPKHHGIYQYFLWFSEKIRLYRKKEKPMPLKKWNICFVNFGINIGSEINGVRPAIIFQRSRETYRSDVIIIPIGTKKQKKKGKFDVIISPNKINGLREVSVLKIQQIRCISKKRIQKYMGILNDKEIQDNIEINIMRLFGIRKTPLETQCRAGHTHLDKNPNGY